MQRAGALASLASMTDATSFDISARADSPRNDTVQLPQPVPFGAPVLISDCASPLVGETLLGLLWKRLDNPEQG